MKLIVSHLKVILKAKRLLVINHFQKRLRQVSSLKALTNYLFSMKTFVSIIWRFELKHFYIGDPFSNNFGIMSNQEKPVS